ncbi:hypothetical protein DICPUDRAFT_83697 [Dictyostelium purpureum]|uniref:Carbohydrate binding domain-containing protein n=1 Tax=Dictyostelium purpureum TaxID=5786 RepID=F1A0C1_DICPU|nr:uncharacterized protein DICPUDRAFT_83697 [Dictyostelium purpureum]EGC30345.1 hypothetical protein DICPUDRAFT_83697 [Dictyostelium purpureum]|eukprot:XP_003293115.1 hypothetical protein DICPUDRAFT_83697 [Dictyostelium purpureum]
MKFVQLLCALLLCLAVVSANVSPRDVSLTQESIGSWKQGKDIISQYSVTINNHTNKVITSIHIGTDHSLTLRLPSDIWNIERLSNGDLTLAKGQTIAAHSSTTFYFILKGTHRANLVVKSVQY